MADLVHPARALWWLFEPVHSVTYFLPESREAYEAAGLHGGWRGYFASRSAPLGAVDAPPVIAAFFSFSPAMVERALPEVWTHASPEEALAARLKGSAGALARLLEHVDPAQVELVVEALERAAGRLDCVGRVLAAANAALPRPSGLYERLWQAATVMREHRGDGHVAALVAAGLDGCEALVVRCAMDVRREMLQPMRGWTDEEWDAAAARLVERGWLTTAGSVTELGRIRHQSLEAATDLAAARVWEDYPRAELDRLAAALKPISALCRSQLPVNPAGLPDNP
ncbi:MULTISPECIES: SCO6745 family protein [unclassified Kitasatospora]|uniref:SCO6745 family protein n=1 Tax=unclassified Kitasatospora TaxID=2633591 RepID=UPI0034220951